MKPKGSLSKKLFLLLLSLVPVVVSCASNPYKGCIQNHPKQAALDKAIMELSKRDRKLVSADPRSCIINGPKLFATMQPVESSGRMIPYIIVTSKLLDSLPSNDYLLAVVAYELATYITSHPTPDAPLGTFPHEYTTDSVARDLLAAADVNEPANVLFETLEWIQRDSPSLADRKSHLLSSSSKDNNGKRLKLF